MIQPFDDGQATRSAIGDAAALLAASEDAPHGVAGAEPEWDGENGVDGFALSKRLRYLDSMAGFDGRRGAA